MSFLEGAPPNNDSTPSGIPLAGYMQPNRPRGQSPRYLRRTLPSTGPALTMSRSLRGTGVARPTVACGGWLGGRMEGFGGPEWRGLIRWLGSSARRSQLIRVSLQGRHCVALWHAAASREHLERSTPSPPRGRRPAGRALRPAYRSAPRRGHPGTYDLDSNTPACPRRRRPAGKALRPGYRSAARRGHPRTTHLDSRTPPCSRHRRHAGKVLRRVCRSVARRGQ